MEEFKDSKVLITGGLGFIGSHLVKRILKEGGKVFILERKGSNPWRIGEVIKKVNIIEGDISKFEDINKLIKSINPDYVFHLAAYGVDSSKKEYSDAINTNIIGTVNVLNSIKDTQCKKFINMGSCAEYGNKKGLMEEKMYLDPVSIYGSTKACSTILAHQIARLNNINIVTLRPFGIFGEGEAPHKIFCHIILSLIKGEDVALTDCEQYRDYCYVENIIDGMVLAAKNNSVKNEIFNIASGNIHQLKYYVNLIFENIDTDKKPLYGAIPYRKNEMWAPKADINKIKSLLHWTPKVSLEEGIVKTIEWYEKNKKFYLETDNHNTSGDKVSEDEDRSLKNNERESHAE
ncbi:SDR family NAD(P)-dependent oxidoreductase [Clostridium pasteurianum]|uniref:NAD-dependent epimerase/dehydratase family protein n=1 Tax=Clostridium pasteurianum TaxID=1501 RepID=UPI0022608541|nr:SDR family NAD(P)-dependent oxidoreductase [Clostridium pasteurianum]UZW15059.1 SDR family NAD(P)-dependent oxidoreductase [Clostridium pasteurianum]